MRFETVVPIGHGGMSEVFKAWDEGLQRFVALKFLRTDDPVMAQRLLREARAQARLDHPNIARVFEVGEYDGRPFIAMQLVDGRPFGVVAAEMTLEEKITTLRRVAEAAQHAHAHALVHRDLKPDNILVERLEDGCYKPYVVDFGLVREGDRGSLTVTGEVLGTPAYMAPEQARGDLASVDRRTDVYALGAVLYELLVGRPPFGPGSGPPVLLKVLEADPDPPRRIVPSVPADLELVALKCLEKERRNRYDSAQALADDLGRYLRGEPVVARRASLAARLLRRARRRPLVATVVVAATIVALAAGGVAVEARRSAATRARLASSLGQEVERLSGMLRNSALSPLHDVRPERRRVREGMTTIETETQRPGGAAAGPGHWALGRALTELGELGAAREHLEQAWQLGYREPEVGYALGLVLGRLYQAELKEIALIRDDALRAARRQRAERELRDPALDRLRGTPGVADAGDELVVALIALCDGRLEEAVERAGRALELEPWRFEAALLAGDAVLAGLEATRQGGNHEGAQAALQAAEGWYRRATEVGRSSPSSHASLCGLAAQAMELELHERGGRIETWYGVARDSCGVALTADPDSVDALLKLSSAHNLVGRARAGRGEDPLPAFAESLATAERAARLAPSSGPAQRALGDGRLFLADHRRRLGEDSWPEVLAAFDAYQRAVELEPFYVKSYNGLGLACIDRAEVEVTRGVDPSPTLDTGIAALERAVELVPGYTHAHNNRGILHRLRGEQAIRTGGDPRPALTAAAESFARAIASNPSYTYAYNNLGNVHMMAAEYSIDHGVDPTTTMERALASYRQALERNPKWALPHVNTGIVHRLHGRWLQLGGEDPTTAFGTAVAELETGLAMLGPHPTVFAELAHTHLLAASALNELGRSPAAALAAAERAVGALLGPDPASAQAHRLAGGVHLVRARWQGGHGASPLSELAAAERSLTHALEHNPQLAEAAIGLAEVAAERAEWEGRTGAPATGALQEGIARARQALAVNPELTDAHLVLARLQLVLARSGRAPAAAAEAETAIAEAVRINPMLRRRSAALTARLGPTRS